MGEPSLQESGTRTPSSGGTLTGAMLKDALEYLVGTAQPDPRLAGSYDGPHVRHRAIRPPA